MLALSFNVMSVSVPIQWLILIDYRPNLGDYDFGSSMESHMNGPYSIISNQLMTRSRHTNEFKLSNGRPSELSPSERVMLCGLDARLNDVVRYERISGIKADFHF